MVAPPLAPYLARRQRMVFEILKRTPLWVFPWFPLALMLCIFFARYAVAVALCSPTSFTGL